MGKPSKTIIIAEAGVNHNGDIKIAKQLVDAAAEAGADFVKFQSFQSKQLATEKAKQAKYQLNAIGNTQNQLKMLYALELKADDHYALIKHCNEKHIKFLSSAFDAESIELLQKLDLEFWKIPSGEITNLPLP